MFYNCNSLTQLDVSNWDTSESTEMNSMFMDCTQLSAIDISNWNVEKVTTMGNMFTGANLLTDDVLDFQNGVKSVTNIKSNLIEIILEIL